MIEAAELLEKYKENWNQKFMLEENRNRDLDWNQRNYTYFNGSVEVKYTIAFKDGTTLTETSFDWFVQNLRNAETIDYLYFIFTTTFWTKNNATYNSNSYDDYNKIHISLDFRENNAEIDVQTTLQENEGRNMYNGLMQIFNKCENRHDKIIKNKGRIIQAYCMSVGIFWSYIVLGLCAFLIMNKPDTIPEFLIEIFDNSLIVVLGQWLIAFLLGNMFAYKSIYNLYEPIIPNTMYMGYDYTMKAGRYRDDVQDFKSHSEVHIGKYYDAESRRNKIKSKYSFAKFIVFLQVIASVIIYFALQIIEI